MPHIPLAARALLPVGLLTLAACAPRPDAIAPATLPPEAFAAVPCAEVGADLAAARTNLAALSSAQDAAATGDAVGVFLLGVPVSSAVGGDKSGLVAVAKGQVLGLEARADACRAGA